MKKTWAQLLCEVWGHRFEAKRKHSRWDKEKDVMEDYYIKWICLRCFHVKEEGCMTEEECSLYAQHGPLPEPPKEN